MDRDRDGSVGPDNRRVLRIKRKVRTCSISLSVKLCLGEDRAACAGDAALVPWLSLAGVASVPDGAIIDCCVFLIFVG